MAPEDYGQSAQAVKAELKKLEAELQKADARGDRRGALDILSRMLELQRKFMERWPYVQRSDQRSEGGSR